MVGHQNCKKDSSLARVKRFRANEKPKAEIAELAAQADLIPAPKRWNSVPFRKLLRPMRLNSIATILETEPSARARIAWS